MNKRAEYFLSYPESKWKQDLVLYLGFLDEYYKKIDYEKLPPEEIIKKYDIRFEESELYESEVVHKGDKIIYHRTYQASFNRNGIDYYISFNFAYSCYPDDREKASIYKGFYITFKGLEDVKRLPEWYVSSWSLLTCLNAAFKKKWVKKMYTSQLRGYGWVD